MFMTLNKSFKFCELQFPHRQNRDYTNVFTSQSCYESHQEHRYNAQYTTKSMLSLFSKCLILISSQHIKIYTFRRILPIEQSPWQAIQLSQWYSYFSLFWVFFFCCFFFFFGMRVKGETLSFLTKYG